MTQKQLLPGIMQWRIGKKKVTVINDCHFPVSENYFNRLPEEGIKKIQFDGFRSEWNVFHSAIQTIACIVP